ncbi:site-specific integrase [Alteromonas lipotrueiana]|uniref:site-specific integrase n=1 Tax=Alteromonas lipotrueiana TaxID=2803815 RepID=UPI001FEAD620|nr:site-specific integrase [Alteromonas lipotrueiana]
MYVLLRKYSSRTVFTYLKWISAFIYFYGKPHPSITLPTMGDNEVEPYLEHLALNANVSPRTQASALNSISFLYKPSFRFCCLR